MKGGQGGMRILRIKIIINFQKFSKDIVWYACTHPGAKQGATNWGAAMCRCHQTWTKVLGPNYLHRSFYPSQISKKIKTYFSVCMCLSRCKARYNELRGLA